MRRASALSVLMVLICALVLGLGCSVAGTEDPSFKPEWVDFSRFTSDTTALRGEWAWKRTVCCFSDFEVSTSSSTGETKTVIFTPCDTVEVYRNERLKREVTYDEYLDDAQWGTRADTFAISRVYRDGAESLYVRAD